MTLRVSMYRGKNQTKNVLKLHKFIYKVVWPAKNEEQENICSIDEDEYKSNDGLFFFSKKERNKYKM